MLREPYSYWDDSAGSAEIMTKMTGHAWGQKAGEEETITAQVWRMAWHGVALRCVAFVDAMDIIFFVLA